MAVAVILPIYGINSNERFSSMKQMLFPSAGTFAQPVSAPMNNMLGNLIYSQVTTDSQGSTAFYSSLTVAQIQTLINA